MMQEMRLLDHGAVSHILSLKRDRGAGSHFLSLKSCFLASKAEAFW